MGKPTGAEVAAKAIAAVAEGHAYADMDCQALVEYCVNQCGGSMAYAGSNAMARSVAYMATLQNAKAEGKLVPGAGLLIHEEDESGLPAKYQADGLGDFSHVGLYVGENALTDTDKNGKSRSCSTVHASASRGRVCGGTISGGWTHVVLFKEIDYSGLDIPSGVVVGGTLTAEDTVKETPEGIATTTKTDGKPDVSGYYTVTLGSLGGAVRRLQTWLQDLGFVLVGDGEFGAITDNAVRYFQKTNGLTVDGIVGQRTWQALADARWAAMAAQDTRV